MKKSVAILLILVVLVCSIASAFALTCETCGKTFSKYCHNKHHHYTKYIQCTRQTNCDFRGNYYSNYYKDSTIDERTGAWGQTEYYAKKTSITLGDTDGKRTIVRSGLNAESLLIVSSTQELHDGMTVVLADP